jgi:hypothetical protein
MTAAPILESGGECRLDFVDHGPAAPSASPIKPKVWMSRSIPR